MLHRTVTVAAIFVGCAAVAIGLAIAIVQIMDAILE